MRNSLWIRPLYQTPHARYANRFLRLLDDPGEITQSSQIISHLKSSIDQWTHPLLLPVLVAHNYRIRSHLFPLDLNDQVVALERQTGVVFAGRVVKAEELNMLPENIPRQKIRRLTRDMHPLMTEIIFFGGVVEWITTCGEWLEALVKQVDDLDIVEERNNEILEMVTYWRSDSESLLGHQKSLKERVQSQINVVC